MKAFLTHGYGPRGAERAVFNLLQALPPADGAERRLLLTLGGRDFPALPAVEAPGGPLQAQVLALYRAAGAAWRAGDPVDLVFTNGNFAVVLAIVAGLQWRARLYGRGARCRLVLWEHCLPGTHFPADRSWLRRTLAAWCYRRLVGRAAHLVAPSPVILDEIASYQGRLPVAKKTRLDNPITVWPAVGARSDTGQRPWPRFVFAGALSQEKQPQQAIDWVLEARRSGRHPDAVLDLFGDGPLRPALETWIREHRAGDFIRLRGYSERLTAELQDADLLVCASRFETFCNVITEARMVGCPVLTTPWTGVHAIYGDDPGVQIADDRRLPPNLTLRPPGPAATDAPSPDGARRNFSADRLLQQLLAPDA